MPDYKNFFGSTNYDPNGPKSKPKGYGLNPDRADLSEPQSKNTKVDPLKGNRTLMKPAPVKDVMITNNRTGKTRMVNRPAKYKNK